jgi:hypothetical protein
MPEKLPQFFITGTVKGGTTSLYNYLYQHPGIYMCPVKEPHFFCTDIDPSTFRDQYRRMINTDISDLLEEGPHNRMISSAFIRDFDTYRKLFRWAGPGQVAGESSTSYLISKVAAENIYKLIPDAKIIIMLREPAQRAYSHYLMNLKTGSVEGTFIDEIKKDMEAEPKGWGITRLYIEHGFYYEQVKRYLDLFGEKRVKVILNEDLSADTEKIVRETYLFLSVDPLFKAQVKQRHNTAAIPSSLFSRYVLRQNRMIKFTSLIVPRFIRNAIYSNVLITKKIPVPDTETKIFLSELYREDTLKLQQLIKRDLTGWLQ